MEGLDDATTAATDARTDATTAATDARTDATTAATEETTAVSEAVAAGRDYSDSTGKGRFFRADFYPSAEAIAPTWPLE